VITTEYEEIKLRLPWPIICKLAVKALIERVDFEAIIEMAVRDRVAKGARNV
jgi:hypothetical protein